MGGAENILHFVGVGVTWVVGRIMAPKDIHALMLRACEYIILNGKKDFGNVIDIKGLGMGRLSGWAQSNHTSREPFLAVVRKTEWQTEERAEKWNIASFEEGGRG